MHIVLRSCCVTLRLFYQLLILPHTLFPEHIHLERKVLQHIVSEGTKQGPNVFLFMVKVQG